MRNIIFVLAVLSSTCMQAAIYYVAKTGNNTNAGTSWATAKLDVQNAIALASSGDEIWIAAGTYLPTVTASGSPTPTRDRTFLVPDGVKLYGGFDGSESTLLSRRNPNYFISYIPVGNYQTILSGNLGTVSINTDNSYHVITAAIGNTGVGITLDGLIIRDGNANSATTQTINSLTVPRNRGGAMILTSAASSTVDWIIHNCVILENESTNDAGGMQVSFGDLKITNSLIWVNYNTTSGSGGALNMTGDSSLYIENSVFAYNGANDLGGAILVATPSVRIYNSTFSNNEALSTGGGAIRFSSSATVALVNNTIFYDNIFGTATAAGADVSFNGGTTNTFNNCFMQLANAASYAGTLTSCTFGNTNPSFTNSADLDGADNRYFTTDDGYSLASGSTAIGAGSNSAVGSQTKALGYNMRIMGTVDVGAYENLGAGKVRWVNNSGATRPSTVTVDAISQNVYPCTYTSISDAVDETIAGDIVYVTNGNYRNPNRLISTNCSIAGIVDVSATGGQDLSLYINVSQSNILITSETGDYTTSSANLFGYGFNIMSGDNKTIRGFNMDSVRVNGFYNSNYAPYGTSARVSILNNKIINTRGHGIKSDDGSTNVNRKFWAINGNWFENIGFYTPSSCTGTASVSAIWLADAGDTCEIKNNTIINTKWAGFLCTGFGKNSLSGSSGSGKLTVSGNKVSKTIDAGIQIGFPLFNFYTPESADILNNYITEANTGQQLGIGAITMLFSDLRIVKITGNHISNSYNGLAIDIAGWRAKFDTTEVSGNNFCGLVAGSFAVTHKAGYAPNCLCNTRDDLAKYKFANNYWGSPCGPTYHSNPAGNGERLRRDSTLNNVSQHYSLNDFSFTPFATTPFTVAAAGANTCVGHPEIDIKGNNISIVDGDITPSLADSTDFGTGSPLVRRFKIFNTGTVSLTISSILSSGTNAADFVVSGAPSSIAAGDSATFLVTFTGGGAGTRTATITVNNSDCSEKVYDFSIKGIGPKNLILSTPAKNGIKFTRQTVSGSLIGYGEDTGDLYFIIDTAGITSGALTGDTVTITVNTTIDSFKSSNGANQEHAMYLMPRYWNAIGSFAGTVKAWFPYNPADTIQLKTRRDSAYNLLKNTTNPSTLALKSAKLEWFKTVGVPYNSTFIAGIVGNRFPPTIIKPTVSYGITAFGVNYVELAGITSFSGGSAGLAFGPPNSGGLVSLPITWESFDVIANEIGNDLIWKTTSEQNSDYFLVEYSYDAAQWSAGSNQLAAAGNSTDLRSYHFIHPDFNSFVYYRIKQVDKDGRSNFSDIKLAKRTADKEFQVSIYPVKIEDDECLHFYAKGLNQSRVNIQIMDVTGKILVRNSFTPSSDRVKEKIDVLNLVPGVYFVEVSNGQGKEVFKVIK